MGTVVDKLNYLKDTKTAIKNALVEKGVEVADSDTFRSYAQKVADIPAGGGDIDALIEGSLTEISSNVTRIRNNAFYFYNSLNKASFPKLENISGGSFTGCNNLTSVSFPLVKTIESNAFQNCSKLEIINIGLVESIGINAFKNCSSIKSLYLPKLINLITTSSETGAFSYCKSLTEVNFPILEKTSYDTFTYCTSLTKVLIPNLKKIYANTFYGCSSITELSFPLITEIDVRAFYGCTSLTTLYIGTESETVCTLLSTNAIPSNVTDIYVPEALVDSYKTATNWSNFASKIKAYTGETA